MKTKKIGSRLPIKAVFAAIIFGLNTIVWAGNVYQVVVVPKGDEKDLGRGDLNRDGVVDAKDRARLSKLLQGSVVPTYGDVLRGDINLNGRLDYGDSRLLANSVYVVPTNRYLPGDVNGDGKVDQNDLNGISSYLYPSTNSSVDNFVPYNADCNRDGVINNKDITGLYVQVYNIATTTNTAYMRCDRVE